MTTVAGLRGQCRAVLASTAAWPDATLDAFIQDAIRFYSAQFPRPYRHTLALTTGTQAYDLPGQHGFLGLVSVEYPAGEDPHQYLVQAAPWEDFFAQGGQVYALHGVVDTLAVESDTAAGQILFAADVTTGESAVIEYLGLHRVPDVGDDDAAITVPRAHWEALVAFVDFRALWELEADEAVEVTSSSIVLAQLGQSARSSWLHYKNVMDRLHWLTGGGSAWVGWGDALRGPRAY